MVITGALLRGEQGRHISPDVVGANRGTVLATFLDLEDHPIAAVQWSGGYLSLTRLKWLDRTLATPSKSKLTKEPRP